MARARNLIYILYSWLTIISGYYLLFASYYPAMIDQWRQYAIFIILAILSEWLVISLPHGNLSVGFSVVLAAFLLFDTIATAWISAISIIISNVLLNKDKDSFRLTLFNGAQYIISTFVAGYLYNFFGGATQNKLSVDNGIPIVAFIVIYFMVNHILVNLYVIPLMRKYTTAMWRTTLKLDFYTYLVSTPIGLLMVQTYRGIGIIGAILLFSTVLVLSYLIRVLMKLEIQNKELDALYQVAKSLGKSLEMKKTLYLIMQETKRAINFHTGIIYLWHEEKGVLTPASVLSPYKKNLRDIGYKLGEGLIGSVAENMEPAFISDTKHDLSLRNSPGVTQFLRSVMAVPLIVENKINGVMLIGKKEPGVFNEKHLQLLTILGGQAAVAMANALLYKQIKDQSITDGLTQLFNHRLFYQKVTEEFERAKRYSSIFSLIMMDIDNFKKFNDSYGHLIGDSALKLVSKIIKENIRSVDIACRYGGEEFAILLPETSNKQAVIVAERIKSSIANTIMDINDLKLKVTVSVGVTTYPNDSQDLTELVDRVDQALYFSKENGKDKVTNWSEANILANEKE